MSNGCHPMAQPLYRAATAQCPVVIK